MREIKNESVKIIELPDGDLAIEFSDEYMKSHGWKIGDEFSFSLNKDGSVSVKNISHEKRKTSKKSKKKS